MSNNNITSLSRDTDSETVLTHHITSTVTSAELILIIYHSTI